MHYIPGMEHSADESWVFYTCREFACPKKPVLLIGGSLSLCADLLLEGLSVVYLDKDSAVLASAYKQLVRAVPTALMLRFETLRRDVEEGIGDIAARVSDIACVRSLHHFEDPAPVLSQLAGHTLPLVILDSTTEIFNDLIRYETAIRGSHYVCPEHYSCRALTERLALDDEAGVHRFFSRAQVDVPFFRYKLDTCWCCKNPCPHRHTHWAAFWPAR